MKMNDIEMQQPKIRIKRDSEEWCKVPFYEIAKRASTSASSLNYPGVEFEDINAGDGTLNKDVSKKGTTKIGKLFFNGDVLFGKLRPYLKNILLANFTGVAIGDFWVLHPATITSELLYILVNSKEFMRIANISSGSKMPRADWNLVSSSVFAIPKSKEEQKAIGAYFQTLDSLIQSATKKMESLKQVKAASLQAMFPQDGETVPKVRFKGFEGEWYKTIIDNICIKKVSVLSENSLGPNIGNYPVYGATGYIQNIPTYDIPYQYVGIVKDGSGVGRCQLYPAYSSLLGTMQYILPKVGYNVAFLAYLFQTLNFSSYINGSSIPHIYFKDYCGQTVYTPTLKEQELIANYFQSLDSQITLQSQRVEKLKQIKSACLDQMFV